MSSALTDHLACLGLFTLGEAHQVSHGIRARVLALFDTRQLQELCSLACVLFWLYYSNMNVRQFDLLLTHYVITLVHMKRIIGLDIN